MTKNVEDRYGVAMQRTDARLRSKTQLMIVAMAP
eukprot:SAG31_NODE_25562_length_459_cov_0.591667_2_plen_33_part_01